MSGTRHGGRNAVDPILRAVPAAALVGGWIVAWACFAAGPRDAAALVSLVFAAAWWVAVVTIVRSDLADYIIPDGASVAVAALGTLHAAATTSASGLGAEEAVIAAGAAVVLGLGALVLFGAVAEAFRGFGRREALGLGDVKLAGALAIWLSPGDAALALEIAALCAIAALLVFRRGAARDTAVPFGAFMAPAAWLVFVAGPVVRDLLP